MNTHFFRYAFLPLAIITIFTTIVMFLWNILIPGIFGLATINFWQALGLLVLARVLLGGISGRFWMNREMHPRRNPIYKKWMEMTPEDRKEFIRQRHHRHGFRSDFFNESENGKES